MADPRFAVVGIRPPEPAPPRKQTRYAGVPVLSLCVLGLLLLGCLLCGVFGAVAMPETKGKSLQEIEAIFSAPPASSED